MTCLEHLMVSGWKSRAEISYCKVSLLHGEFRESDLIALIQYSGIPECSCLSFRSCVVFTIWPKDHKVTTTITIATNGPKPVHTENGRTRSHLQLRCDKEALQNSMWGRSCNNLWKIWLASCRKTESRPKDLVWNVAISCSDFLLECSCLGFLQYLCPVNQVNLFKTHQIRPLGLC